MSADLPIGGTTGLSHEHSAAVDEAARWFAATHPDPARAAIPVLRERFGLSAREACQALAEAQHIRARC